MQYVEITAAGTFVLKKGAGFLQALVVNTPGTTPTVQIFDNTSAAAPAIAGGAAAFTPGASGTNYAYDCHFSNGLTIVVTGTTPSYTVSFY